MYKVLVDSITGKGSKVYQKNDIINENDINNIRELIKYNLIEEIQEPKPLKSK